MVAVAIIALLAAIAIPAFMRLRRTAQNNRFLNDLRSFSQAFEIYAMHNGAWPPNAGAGVLPAPMVDDIRSANWTNVTPVGGQWNWDFQKNGITAAVSVSNPTADDSQMAQIDAKIDDGDLSTGLFIKSGTRFMYILEQ
jgi:type II secretory pathway pseudopilin PulG